MATYANALAALDGFRTELHTQKSTEGVMSAFAASGAFAAFSTPLTNIHATGVGVRVRNGQIVPNEFVIKVYVFDKVLNQAVPSLMQSFGDVGVDVEALPIQMALTGGSPMARLRPIVGGVSIAPINQNYAGTLGCFVKPASVANSPTVYALSNNHVIFNVDRVPFNTPITQPASETVISTINEVFAIANDKIIIDFNSPNSFDAALAIVQDNSLISLGKMLGIPNYTPQIAIPLPNMEVIKSGRTTGVTKGRITAIKVNGVKVNYGTNGQPHVATFNNCIEIVGVNGQRFSDHGDSGSVILEASTGKPVALLFAGDGVTTTACDFPSLCRRFNVVPI